MAGFWVHVGRLQSSRILVAILVAGWSVAGARAAASQVEYVIAISVDGLRPDAITTLGPGDAPNFYRLRNEGAFTDNARTDYDYSNTLPNHTSMLTGRRVTTSAGHGYTQNADPPANQTIHSNKGSYVASVFDVAHDNGLRTALYSGKTKFVLYPRSYNSTNGAVDVTGPDNGRNKIDRTIINVDSEALTESFITGLENLPYDFSMLHLREPDDAGHASNWDVQNPNSPYLNSVRAVDGYLGMVLDSIETHPALVGRTLLIVTADHGGIQGTTAHSNATNPQAYTVPFYVWGPGVPVGVDLYAMNSGTRLDPGTGQPTYSNPDQPIRNGDVANLALDLLGLGPVPGSTINPLQNLTVLSPYPPGDYNYDFEVNASDYAVWQQEFGTLGRSAADGNGDGRVDAADYLFWRRHVQAGGGAAAAQLLHVPEPHAGALFLGAMLGWIAVTRQSAQGRRTVLPGVRSKWACVFAILLLPAAGSQAAVVYPGNGGTSFGGVLRNGALTVDDLPDGTINFSFQPGASFSRNLVIYIDSKPGGYANNYLMDYTPGSDNQRAASGFNETTKVHALMQFAPGFDADYVVALWVRANTAGAPSGSLRTLTAGTGADAGRVVLTDTVLIDLAGAQTSPPTPVTFNFNATDIGLTVGAGDSFRFVATYLNGSNAVRSNEFIGGVSRSTLYDTNGNLAAVTMSDYRTYTLFTSSSGAESPGNVPGIPEPSTIILAVFAFAEAMSLRRRR